MKKSVVHHTYNGEQAITISFGRYTAMILPEIGGNLVSFKDVERGLSFLRTPTADDMHLFKAAPFMYGIPVLFPPNRYEDGTFTFNNRRYNFPINEPSTRNHLHGLLYDIPWSLGDTGTSNETAYVEVVQDINEHHVLFGHFPHKFSVTVRYSLSDGGLQQDVHIRNNGVDAMPSMLGFHTTLNVPFSPESSTDDYRFMATIGERWEMSERQLPTGKPQELKMEEQQIKDTGISPFSQTMDNHYTALPQNQKNYMALTDTRLGVRLIYDVGLNYTQWMIFNNYGRGEFICPEPQTSVVNAPNTGLSYEESGMVVLEPGDTWSETSRFYVEELW